MTIAKDWLWVDCLAGAIAGAVMLVLTLGGWLGPFYGIPGRWLVGLGLVNVAYGTFSFSIARRPARPPSLIRVLVIANATWSLACLGMAASFARTATAFGLIHLVIEAAFVGTLAALEWRDRDRLRRAA